MIVEAPHVMFESSMAPGIEATRREFQSGALRDKLERLHHDNTDSAFEGWCRTWRATPFRQWNIEAFLEGIQVPMLTVQGVDDEYASWAQVDAICRRVRTDVLQLQCGHWPHLSMPHAVIEECRVFLECRAQHG